MGEMMNNKVLLLAFSAVSLSALVACGSSSSGGTGAADVDYIFSSYSEMNKSVSCNYSNEGKVAYLTDIESAVICSDGYWEDYDLNAKDSTSESKNIVVDTVFSYSSLPSCNYYREDSVVYVRSLQINLVCDGYSWREEALTLVPTSVSTMKALPTCVPSIAGAIVYVNGIGEDVICSEKHWVEYRHWLESSSSMNTSSSSYDDDDESSSSYKTDEEEVLGKCSAENNGMLAYDSNHVLGYSTNYYYYCDGTWESWEAAPSEMIDTLGWESAEDGIFRAGDYSYKSNRYRDLPVICNFNGEGGSVYFVHDGSWRIATDMEVCVLRLCNNDHAGDTELLDGYTYRCNGEDWVFDSLYSSAKVDRFKKGVTYGTLLDERDNISYKTVVIGGKTWMAENLKYADSASTITLKAGGSFCWRDDPANCELGGRTYKWAALMGIASTYNTQKYADSLVKKPVQGVCPSGWHVPDSTEWKSLISAANNSAAMIKSETGWPYDEDAVLPNNALGFTAVPAGYTYSSYDYGNLGEVFCTMHQVGASSFVGYSVTYSSSYISRRESTKVGGCHLRCVQDSEE
jgi:uncharacterized protein (TIGR02145 family)